MTTDDHLGDRVYACGCIETRTPAPQPEGVEVLEGAIEWYAAEVWPCGNRETCQHPMARGTIIDPSDYGDDVAGVEIVLEGEA